MLERNLLNFCIKALNSPWIKLYFPMSVTLVEFKPDEGISIIRYACHHPRHTNCVKKNFGISNNISCKRKRILKFFDTRSRYCIFIWLLGLFCPSMSRMLMRLKCLIFKKKSFSDSNSVRLVLQEPFSLRSRIWTSKKNYLWKLLLHH